MGLMVDRGAKTQEYRFVDEGSELVPRDGSDEEVDGIGSNVDGRSDRRERRHPAQAAGKPIDLTQCRRQTRRRASRGADGACG